MVTVSRKTRCELVKALAERYSVSTRPEKARILDEFVALSGYHRKHAIRVLRVGVDLGAVATRGRRPRIYDEAVRQSLIVLWEASDRICAKRLKPLLPLLVDSLERNGHLRLDAKVRAKLLNVGASTIDRLLSPARSIGGPRSRRHQPPLVRAQIPIRTFADWGDPGPGFMEVDLVAHCGGSMAGSFVHTLTLTDIASGWTECIALAVREASLVVNALDRLKDVMPFELRGIDTDNGGEFVNDVVLRFTEKIGIKFTRSRPYKKNDQAWVEQKNGSVVRRMVGYGRLEGLAASEALSRLYESSRLFVNFFQPSFKLLRKERIGARVRKTYHSPETPCARLLASADVAEAAKVRLRAVLATLDPLRLLDEIRTMQRHVAGLAAGQPMHSPPRRDADLDRFMESLASAWRAGEVRPTHAAEVKPRRYWRTRKDPLADVWPRVVVWLEIEPDRTAKELLIRLRHEGSAVVGDEQLRTLQRRVKIWRAAAARRLVFSGGDSVDLGPSTVSETATPRPGLSSRSPSGLAQVEPRTGSDGP
jgi:hypothetical protein